MTKTTHRETETEKASSKGVMIRIGLVLIAGIAVAAVARTTTSDAELERTSPVQTATLTPASSPIGTTDTPVSLPHVPNPAPWQYDPVTNKHYHQPHGHWHSGPPPANAGQ